MARRPARRGDTEAVFTLNLVVGVSSAVLYVRRGSRTQGHRRGRAAGELSRDEFANGPFGRAALEAHHEPHLKSLGQTLQSRHARLVLATFDAGDR